MAQIENEIHPPLDQEPQRALTKTGIQSIDRIVSPILTIPVEITSEIFLHCLPDEPQQPSKMTAPMLLGAVCREWRIISRGDPRLWATLKISIWRSDGFKLLVQDWLLRAGSMPLSLNFILSPPPERCRFPISPYDADNNCCFRSLQPSTIKWDHLTTFRGDFFAPDECLALLRRAPGLVRCEFRDIEPPDEFPPSPVEQLLLSRLEYLALAAQPEYELYSGCVYILQSLDVPYLRVLDLHCYFPLADAPFISFLKRAPSIDAFTARFDGPEEEDVTDDVADAVFRLMPSLNTLCLHLDTDELIFQFLSLLANSSTFLPHIQTLTFSVLQEVTYTDACTESLVAVLTARWDPPAGVSQLLDFEFNFPGSYSYLDGQPEDVAERLSGLMESGMKLRIGPREAPWVKSP
ncbi:hypothetical protein FB451DRAFT_1094126 [Mycena latifolia]|nr:hypothetical protein FB451DRAFT_1094126 [Mycena latifolia]